MEKLSVPIEPPLTEIVKYPALPMIVMLQLPG
jgi:hypothetical protein